MLVIVPAAGLIDHVTAVFDAPFTDAVNCFACDALSEVADGDTDTETVGFSVIVAVAILVVSAVLFAVTVTVWTDVMLAGAV